MKKIYNYIQEKLVINKDSKIKNNQYEKFCDVLKLDKKNDGSKHLYELYQTDCDKIIGNNITSEQRMSTDFELIYMLAIMLLDDNYTRSEILNLGYTIYKGNNNPYDYSWFEEENNKGETVLDIIQNLYRSNNKFEEIFNKIYWYADDACLNKHESIDGIWNLHY